jgi:iron complex transport system substrate-binding protein
VRVVSLACSNTEIVAALGCADLLVGVDDHSDHPADAVAALPRLGPDLSIDVEAVARLEPDLVLASLTLPGHERVLKGLDRVGVRYVAPDPRSLADVARDVRDIAALLGVPDRGEAVAAALTFPERPPTGVRVLVEWWPKPVIVPGAWSWVTDLIRLAGGVNPWGDRPVRSTPLRDEEVLADPPDVVVVSWCGVPLHRYRLDVVTRRPTWVEVPAVANRRVVPVTEAFLGRPGPRLVDGYRALCAAIDAAIS